MPKSLIVFLFTQLAMVTILQSTTFVPRNFPERGPSATAHECALLIILLPDFGQLHSDTEPSTILVFPHSLASERPPYRCCPFPGSQLKTIHRTCSPFDYKWDQPCGGHFTFRCRPPPRPRADTSLNASQSQTLGFKSLIRPRPHIALRGEVLCPPSCGVVAAPEAVYHSSVENQIMRLMQHLTQIYNLCVLIKSPWEIGATWFNPWYPSHAETCFD